jgi:hypothetical protein
VNTIERRDNQIVVTGELVDFHRFLAHVHTIVEKLGYTEIILDLGRCRRLTEVRDSCGNCAIAARRSLSLMRSALIYRSGSWPSAEQVISEAARIVSNSVTGKPVA